ncbi:MAG: glycosyltransferase family A protein [Planctomycetota bacterium]
MKTIDVLMVTYQAPESTRLSLGRLLDSCDDAMRVWLWHNGDHEETLEVVTEFSRDPRVARFHHSRENLRLWAPTNWLLGESDADFLSKVDDDNVVPEGWARTLAAAHDESADLGVLGSWRFQDEDFVPELAERKIRSFGRIQVMVNLWVEGSCFLMKRACRDQRGVLAPKESMPTYFRSLVVRHGWTNGWLYPFVRYENLDDPRSEHSLLRNQGDFAERMPLTAQYNGVESIEAWTDQLRRSARAVQAASPDPRDWSGWRLKRKRLKRALQRVVLRQKHHW